MTLLVLSPTSRMNIVTCKMPPESNQRVAHHKVMGLLVTTPTTAEDKGFSQNTAANWFTRRGIDPAPTLNFVKLFPLYPSYQQ
jgi:hypothetical protein